jgi:hypothetical protein
VFQVADRAAARLSPGGGEPEAFGDVHDSLEHAAQLSVGCLEVLLMEVVHRLLVVVRGDSHSQLVEVGLQRRNLPAQWVDTAKALSLANADILVSSRNQRSTNTACR